MTIDGDQPLSQRSPPVVITGMPSGGTSWIGKVFEASGRFVHINEPLNPRHPPGRSPGVLRAPVPHEYLYLTNRSSNYDQYASAFRDTFQLRYHPFAELRANHGAFDVLRMVKYATSFSIGRIRNKIPLLKDPYASVSVPWFAEEFGAKVIVVVRHPLGVIASFQRRNLPFDIPSFLNQPLLMDDFLETFRADLEGAARDGDRIAGLSFSWAAIHHVLWSSRSDKRVRLVRYEDLCSDPTNRFAELFGFVDVSFTAAIRRFVHVTSHVSETDRSPPRRQTAPASSSGSAFQWRLSRHGLMSRTAFRPMNSLEQLTAWRRVLSPDDIERIQTITRSVCELFYPDDYPS